MKRLLLILGFALMAVACNKDDDLDGCRLVVLTPNNTTISKEMGGVVTVGADIDAYVQGIVKVFPDRSFDAKHFIRSSPPDYIIFLDDVMKYEEYEADGCKVIPNGLREFTIIVEPNCDCDYIEVQFGVIYESEKYGKHGGHATSRVMIKLE